MAHFLKLKVSFFFCRNREGGFLLLCCGPPLSVRSRTTKCKKPRAIPLQAPLSVCTHHLIMSGADIVKGSERVSSLGAHRFILFGVVCIPTAQRWRLFCLWRTFFKAKARFLVGGHSLICSGAMMQTRPCRSSSAPAGQPCCTAAMPGGAASACSGVMRPCSRCARCLSGITAHQPDGSNRDEEPPGRSRGQRPIQAGTGSARPPSK